MADVHSKEIRSWATSKQPYCWATSKQPYLGEVAVGGISGSVSLLLCPILLRKCRRFRSSDALQVLSKQIGCGIRSYC